MHRFSLLAVALAITVAACTSSNAGVIVTSTTDQTPITTLAPLGSTTTSAPGTDPTTTTTIALPENECVVGADASVEGYAQGCSVLGIEILAPEDVEPSAVTAAAERVYEMLLSRPDLLAAMVDQGLAGRIIDEDQRITELPEFADLYDQYPGFDWIRRGRSFPGTELVPYFAGAEENLLCSDGDFYEGEDDFVRAFALTIKRFGIDTADPATSLAIDQAYGRAIAQGLWNNTLAEINADEYWMEGAQSYFDANLEDTAEDREPNSSHNAINTRDELLDYDPALWTIAASVFGEGEWRPSCP
ncbi:MAG TPA: hypothetical protein VLA29_03430 [Acidimicrobiia bacterium]|nr:hypothetical protein [Acidimicrobiia bacterium]